MGMAGSFSFVLFCYLDGLHVTNYDTLIHLPRPCWHQRGMAWHVLVWYGME